MYPLFLFTGQNFHKFPPNFEDVYENKIINFPQLHCFAEKNCENVIVNLFHTAC